MPHITRAVHRIATVTALLSLAACGTGPRDTGEFRPIRSETFHFVENRAIGPDERLNDAERYSYEGVLANEDAAQRAKNSEELFVILAFSGGGTRAAAFSFGVLERLRDMRISVGGQTRSLLDEVDMISSNSGGSYTAIYYGLYRDAAFAGARADFAERFLNRDYQGELFGRLLAQGWRALGSGLDRSDLGAEVGDEKVFRGGNYADLLARGRPFIVVNAADSTRMNLFEFTQDDFDLLCSDLRDLPASRAAMASSAVNGVFSALRLNNYYGSSAYCRERTRWTQRAYEGERDWSLREDDSITWARARQARRYVEKACFERVKPPGRNLVCNVADPAYTQNAKWYVHLSDGGPVDNRGLRSIYRRLTVGPGGEVFEPDSFVPLIRAGRIKRVLVISVDAAGEPDTNQDARLSGPGPIDLILSAIDASIRAASIGAEQSLQSVALPEFGADAMAGAKPASDSCVTGGPFCAIWISFDDIELRPREREEETAAGLRVRDCRARFKNIETALSLPTGQIDALRAVAGALVAGDVRLEHFLTAAKLVPAGATATAQAELQAVCDAALERDLLPPRP